MKVLSNFFKSFWFIFVAIVMSLFTFQVTIPALKNELESISEIHFYGFKVFPFALIIFISLFFILFTIIFIIKAIYHMWLCAYYTAFYKEKDHIELIINNDNEILKSFMVYKNGDKIPIEPSVLATIPTEVITPDKTETKEENNNGEIK